MHLYERYSAAELYTRTIHRVGIRDASSYDEKMIDLDITFQEGDCMRYVVWAVFTVIMLVIVQAGACQLTPGGQEAIEEAVKVPGLEQSLEVKDRAIRTAILVSIKSDVELLQNNIEVEVNNAKVILTGTVPTEEMKARAESYAKQTEGVLDVLNKIEVDPSLAEQQFSLDEI